MRRTLAILFLVSMMLVQASLAGAQSPVTFGIFDDPQMTRTWGDMTGPTKEIYLGLRWTAGTLGTAGFEFSIAGLRSFASWTVEWMDDPNLVIGSVAAPLDTISGTGGVNVAWPACQRFNPWLVARLTLFAAQPPSNHVLQVRRRYPPNNPQLPYAFAVPCDLPCFGCIYRLGDPLYVLNPTIAAQPHCWSAIKKLYDTPARR